jgi:hypothetical protein
MKIKSNASSSEISSPFYITNEAFCKEFENYIASKDGMVKGKYNAWSYFIQGEIMAPKKWHLKYKKATYTSTGNLIFSSKKQNLLTLAEWSTPWLGSTDSEFFIQKKNSVSLIKRLTNSRLSSFHSLKDYVIDDYKKDVVFKEKLFKKLEHLFKSGEVYSIQLKNNHLTISLRTEFHHFETFENLLDL